MACGPLIAHPFPTVLGNDIDKDVKPTEDVLFHRFMYFFTLWSHVNTAMTGIYVYFAIIFTIGRCQIFILEKKQIWYDFSELNLDTQMN